MKKPKQKLSVLDGTKLYAQLRQQITQAGILERSYTYYTCLFLFAFGGFFYSAYQIVTLSQSAQFLLWCILFGFFVVQVFGFIHDGGHRAVFTSNTLNDFIGHLAAFLLASDFDSWKFRHNLHHAHPNVEHEDPDFIELPFMSFTKKNFQKKKGIWKTLSKYQVLFYYPMQVLFNNFGLRLYGLVYYKNHFHWRKTGLVTLYVAAMFAWFVLPFLAFPFEKALTFFIASNLTIGLYSMNVIAPNHKAMPKLERGVKLSFMEQQIMTANNVYGNWFTDFLYLGLNYQIEHHLFPNCPRNKLKLIQPYVLEVCRKMKLEYSEVTVWESNVNILKELNSIATSSKTNR